MDSVRLAQRILPDAFTLHIFEVYPGTVLGDIAVKEGLIDPQRENTEFIGQTDTALRLPGFPREEILRCFRLFPFRVYRKSRPFKAVLLYFYYSPYASVLVRLLHPFKRILRKLAMGV